MLTSPLAHLHVEIHLQMTKESPNGQLVTIDDDDDDGSSYPLSLQSHLTTINYNVLFSFLLL